MRVIYIYALLFLISQASLADMKSANDAMSRGDYETAAKEFEKLAEQGNKKAQAQLGYMYYIGEGVKQDHVQAVKWYRKAAILGDKDSQYNLAVAYAFGEGVKQDYKEAFQWYRRAAAQGHTKAQYSIGIAYAYGEGTAKDPGQAAKWLQKAAEQGYERAQVLLGSLYHTGDGVDKDYEKAAHWYRKAADRGNAIAQYNLGALYRAGNGVEQDYKQAARWFRLSADQGYVVAQNELANIERGIAGAPRPPTPKEEKITPEPPSPVDSIEPEEAIASAETVPEAQPRRGFFARLFSKKDQPPSYEQPSEAGIVYASPEEIAAVEATLKDLSVMREEPEETIEGMDTVSDTPEPPGPVDSMEPEEAITSAEAVPEAQPRRGFFARLFSKKDQPPSYEQPSEAGIVYASPEEIEAAQIQTFSSDIQSLQTKAELGNPIAQFQLGTLYYQGKNVGKDFSQALTWYRRAAEQGNSEAQYNLANMYLMGEGVEQNDLQAKQWYEKAAEQGHTDAQHNLQSLQRVVDTTQQAETSEPPHPVDSMEPEEAIASAEAVPEAQPRRGFFARLFSKKDQPPSYEQPSEAGIVYASPEEIEAAQIQTFSSDIQSLQTKAELGNPIAQFQLGTLYYQGKNVGKDFSQALTWYRRAAEQGNSEAQYNLANMYLMGEGVEQNDLQAKQWYEKAAEQGHTDAQHNLQSLQRVVDTTQQAETSEPPHPVDSMEPEEATASAEAVPEAQPRRGFFARLFSKKDQPPSYEQPSEAGIVYASPEEIAAVEATLKDLSVMREEPEETIEGMETVSDTPEPPGPVDSIEPEEAIASAEAVPEAQPRRGFLARLFSKKDQPPSYEQPSEAGIVYASPEEIEAAQIQTFSSDIQSLQTKAELGNPIAQFQLGTLYYQGKNVGKDFSQALTWYRRAAEQGNSEAQYNLANMYLMGEGVEQNDLQAKQWYEKAAEQGHTDAQHNLQSLQRVVDTTQQAETSELITPSVTDQDAPPLNTAAESYQLGLSYELGDDVPQSYILAFKHFRNAAEKNHAPAQYKLGVAYAHGQGTEQDLEKAKAWYKKSALQGYTLAQRALGALYLLNEQNKPLALAWYNILANNDGKAIDIYRRDKLQKELTEEEIEQAKQLEKELLTQQ